MGSQDEYLRNFCILQTNKGIVPLTDPLQIAVYRSLQGCMKRPSDLAAELNLSSSSLHFIIDKMADSGIIDRSKPESDKKTVYYSTRAKVLASSMDTDDKTREECLKTFSDPLKNYKGLSSLSNMLDCYTSEIGLDIDPLRMSYAESLADAIDIGSSSMEDAVMDVRDVFSKLTGFNFTVFSFSPLTLVVTGDENIMRRAPTLMRFVTRLIENSTGRSFKVVSVEPFNGSETMVKVTMERCEKTETFINTSLNHLDKERFLVVDLDGNAGLMTSDVQISIIDSIYERPLCITDIVNKVDFPRSTITSNLLRMVEEGVISVFYSESGSAYYGLACSILFKKSREMSNDGAEIRNVLDSVKDKEGSFMEGQFLFILAYLRKLGFDSEFLMVVLGAKYMRASGSMDTKASFDTYFGKMSDIAKAIGLSLNVVSIYPLTIGISNNDPDSKMTQAMTFITGMAHQGLEMASSGIFVRSTECKEADENISFKEIYPALSMTPVKGVKVENLAPATSTSKRTSSVKTALLKRSKKDTGKPARTVRYITAAVFMLMLSGLLFLGMGGETDVSAETYTLSIGEGLDVTVTDEEGTVLEYPYSDIKSGSVLTLSMSGSNTIGLVDNGYSYLINPGEDGKYKVTMDANKTIEELVDLEQLFDGDQCTFSIGIPGSYTDATVPIEPSEYMMRTGGLYVTKTTDIFIVPADDMYIKMDEKNLEGSLSNYTFDAVSCKNISFVAKPVETKNINLHGPFVYGGQRLLNETLEIGGEVKTINLKYDGNKYAVVKVNGTPVKMDIDGCFTLQLPPSGDIDITCDEENFLS